MRSRTMEEHSADGDIVVVGGNREYLLELLKEY